MQQTYRAILHGNRIEWIDDPPELSGPTRVIITLLPKSGTDEELHHDRPLPDEDDAA